jgi:hypothetical protein
MPPSLGMQGSSYNEIVCEIVKMDLASDEEGFIYFNDLLFKSMKRIYGEKHILNKVLAEHELKTM